MGSKRKQITKVYIDRTMAAQVDYLHRRECHREEKAADRKAGWQVFGICIGFLVLSALIVNALVSIARVVGG